MKVIYNMLTAFFITLLLMSPPSSADEKPDVSKKVIYSPQNKMEFRILINVTARAEGNYTVSLKNTTGFGFVGHEGKITQFQLNNTVKSYEFMMRILETTESGSYNITFVVYLEDKEVYRDDVMVSVKNIRGSTCVVLSFIILSGTLPAILVRWKK